MAAADVGAIVAAAGVAHGSAFFHLPTKGHVLTEVGQREFAWRLDRFLATPRDLRRALHEVLRLTSLERRLGQ